MTRSFAAHFDGKVIVPDEPVQLPVGKRLQVYVDLAEAPTTQMGELWRRIDSWFARNFIWYQPYPGGANEQDISQARIQLGLGLPMPVVESYLVHNGTGQQSIIESHYLLSLEEVLAAWSMMRGDYEDFPCEPQGPIQPVRWSECWIPIADDGSGDYLCVDMCPVPGGDVGQIILVDHEIGPVKVLATGFDEFLAAFADDLENGKFRVDGRLEMIVRRDGEWLYPQV